MSHVEQQYSRPDAGTELSGEIPNQGAEVHPMFSGEEDAELAAVPLPLRVAHLHLEAVAPDPLDDLTADFLFDAPEFVGGLDVLLVGAADHGAGGRGGCRVDGASIASVAALLEGGVPDGVHPAEVASPFDFDDDPFFQSQGVVVVFPEKEIAASALEADFDGLRHQLSVKAPMSAYLLARRRISFSGRARWRSETWRMRASRTASAVASGSV